MFLHTAAVCELDAGRFSVMWYRGATFFFVGLHKCRSNSAQARSNILQPCTLESRWVSIDGDSVEALPTEEDVFELQPFLTANSCPVRIVALNRWSPITAAAPVGCEYQCVLEKTYYPIDANNSERLPDAISRRELDCYYCGPERHKVRFVSPNWARIEWDLKGVPERSEDLEPQTHSRVNPEYVKESDRLCKFGAIMSSFAILSITISVIVKLLRRINRKSRFEGGPADC